MSDDENVYIVWPDDDPSTEELDAACAVLDDVLGTDVTNVFLDGLPGGCCDTWGYDWQLLFDVVRAVQRWRRRTGNDV